MRGIKLQNTSYKYSKRMRNFKLYIYNSRYCKFCNIINLSSCQSNTIVHIVINIKRKNIYEFLFSPVLKNICFSTFNFDECSDFCSYRIIVANNSTPGYFEKKKMW